MELTNEQVYDLIRDYSKKQMGVSNLVANYYDWEDVANNCYVRYLKSDWEIKYPQTYFWLLVLGEIRNLYKKDKLRGYNEVPLGMTLTCPANAINQYSEDLEERQDVFLVDGPDVIYHLREVIETLGVKSKSAKTWSPDIIYALGSGDKRIDVIDQYNLCKKQFYADRKRFKKEAERYGYT